MQLIEEAEPPQHDLILRIVGVVRCLAAVAIHVIDQGGIPGSKEPGYIQIGYYALEVIQSPRRGPSFAAGDSLVNDQVPRGLDWLAGHRRASCVTRSTAG